MYALLYAFPSGRYVVMMDNFENVIDPETREIEDAELREALGALLEYPQHEVKVVVTTRFASHDLPLVRPELQTRLELDKGLASPYAENILCVIPSRLRCGYQLRQRLLPLLQGRCALAPAPRARPHPGSPLGAPRLPASRALPPVGNIGATARRSEEFPDQLAHISQFLSYGAVLACDGPADARAAFPQHDPGGGCRSSLARRPEITRSTASRRTSFIRRAANCTYSPSNSAPTKKRPSSLAATAVVPDPQKGSKMRSPSRVEATRARRTRRSGFYLRMARQP
jgi:hypothetical protein